MHINANTGLLKEAEGITFIPSPNFNARPQDAVIDLIVLHNISLPPGEFGGPYITELFTNTLDTSQHPYFLTLIDKKVSCHCLIRRSGHIIQYVPFTERAWHAGPSRFEGRENCNDYSVGIELEGEDEVPYTSEQYQVLGRLINCLRETYNSISLDRIVGHAAIAPDRKTDPGPSFDWVLLAQLVTPEIGLRLASKSKV